MVQENVIIVTLNYRLHALGFSCLPGGGIHANVGLKDQLLGIKWVKENISQFNGDPENITLFSESAGAASCHMHVLSKNSRRYFKRAICQSGSAFGDWAFKKDVEQKTRLLGKSLGCKGKTDQEIFETLKHADLEELNLHCMKILSADEKRRTLPFIFKPTFEVDSEDAIITKSPLQLIKDQKDEIKIDIMFGTNDRDGMIMIMDAVKKLDAYDNDPVRFIPTSVNINPMSPNAEALGQEIKKFYFGDEGVCKETIPKLADLMTDFHFKLSDNLSTELHARYQNWYEDFLF
jgi:carboxylesterase type B